jgi:hypothetical protein
VHLNTKARISEYLDSIVRGNDKESSRVQEISINYINSGETFDRKTTIVDTYFFEQIETIFSIIQIQRPWQNVENARTGQSGKKQFNWK